MDRKIDKSEYYRSPKEETIRKDFVKHFRNCPLPDDEILQNLGLFLNSKNLSRILFFDYIYRQIVDIPGTIIEFGTRWGQNISLFAALRGIYEPFYRHRKIIGFDTFTGFPSIGEHDNKEFPAIREGGLACTENYVEYLEKVMEYQEQDNPMSHIRRFEIRAGDAIVEIAKYLEEYPAMIVALAFFDFDLYEPTKKCLEAIKPHLTRGSVLVFDELSDHDSPGETLALEEVFGVIQVKLRRYRYTSRVSYFVVE